MKKYEIYPPDIFSFYHPDPVPLPFEFDLGHFSFQLLEPCFGFFVIAHVPWSLSSVSVYSLTIKYKEIIMNIMYALGNVTGKTTKLIWGATTTTTGSAVRGFKDAFKSPTIITPNDDLEPVTINPQPTTYRQAEMDI